ncbi:hypothetical protein AMTRI_Chr07g28500 [Amborella trichopoda]
MRPDTTCTCPQSSQLSPQAPLPEVAQFPRAIAFTSPPVPLDSSSLVQTTALPLSPYPSPSSLEYSSPVPSPPLLAPSSHHLGDGFNQPTSPSLSLLSNSTTAVTPNPFLALLPYSCYNPLSPQHFTSPSSTPPPLTFLPYYPYSPPLIPRREKQLPAYPHYDSPTTNLPQQLSSTLSNLSQLYFTSISLLPPKSPNSRSTLPLLLPSIC